MGRDAKCCEDAKRIRAGNSGYMRYRHGTSDTSAKEGGTEEMTVAIISGQEGTGKTTQVLGVAKASPSTLWAILELKDKKKIEQCASDTFNVQILYETYPQGHVNAMSVDPVVTLQNVLGWKNSIMHLTELPKTIVIDGISDLRDYAINAWLIKNNEDRKMQGKPPLKGIGEKNIGAWGEVNQTVRDLLEPLINLALVEDINLLMTAQFKEEWLGGDKVGYIPDLKPWMSYPVPCLFSLYSTEKGYSLMCTKDPDNPRWIVEELEKDTGLLKALIAHNLIHATEEVKKAIAVKKEYMVRFKLAGESKKEFVTAVSPEEAEVGLKVMYEKAEDIEVII